MTVCPVRLVDTALRIPPEPRPLSQTQSRKEAFCTLGGSHEAHPYHPRRRLRQYA